MKPKVTVGVCVRNCEDFIKEAVDSIIDQDFPHELMEIIFLDDGSKDNTLSIIQNYASRINIKTKVFYGMWKGLGEARNSVVNNAEGDYIIWVDGDMVLSRDFVRKQVEFMEYNPSVGIAKGRYGLNSGPNIVSTLEIYSRGADKMIDFNKDKSRSLGTGACIYRLEAIRQAGGFDKNIKGYGEDWDAECRVRAAGWKLQTSEAQWRDYERLGLSYGELWRRYVRRGNDLYYFSRKNKGLLKLHRMLPPAGLLSGLRYSLILYKTIHKKLVFLLPFHHMFKTTAWCWGFTKAKLVHTARLLANSQRKNS